MHMHTYIIIIILCVSCYAYAYPKIMDFPENGLLSVHFDDWKHVLQFFRVSTDFYPIYNETFPKHLLSIF